MFTLERFLGLISCDLFSSLQLDFLPESMCPISQWFRETILSILTIQIFSKHSLKLKKKEIIIDDKIRHVSYMTVPTPNEYIGGYFYLDK